MLSMNYDCTFWGTVALILALLSIGLMPVEEGVVLCRGVDGRVEMKTSFGGPCRPSLSSSEGSGSAENTARSCQGDCCGPCDDTPLGNQEVSASLCAKKRASHTHRPYCCAKTSSAPISGLVRTHSQGQSPTFADRIPLTRRTVVLLI